MDVALGSELEQFLTPADVGRLVGMTAAGVKVAVRAGKLPVAAFTARGGRLFRLVDVEAFLTARQARTRCPAGDAS